MKVGDVPDGCDRVIDDRPVESPLLRSYPEELGVCLGPEDVAVRRDFRIDCLVAGGRQEPPDGHAVRVKDGQVMIRRAAAE